MGSCIGVSGDTVHVVWADRINATHGAIYYTNSTDTGLTWRAPIAITDLSGNAWNPAIAVNGSNIHVAWREIDTLSQHRSSHYKHSLDGGNTWAANVLLDTLIADWPAVTVSGNNVYVANDIVTTASPYNTEIFFLKSSDNGLTWSAHQQLTFATGRSEDEAINAQGADVYMSWNDNRNGHMQIFYKHSADYGVTWEQDTAIALPNGYGTMVSVDGQHVDVPYAGAPTGRYQTHLVQSADVGASWGPDMNLTNDTANTYYYPYMVRDGNNIHLTYVKSGAGGQYLHSADGGATWDAPFSMGTCSITPFIAYTDCVLHVIMPVSGHISYLRNPTGNSGNHCTPLTAIYTHYPENESVNVYPNPFTSQTTIEILSSEKAENVLLKVFDVFGREVLNSTLENNSNKLILSKSQLNTGIYFYKVFQKEKVIGMGKLVVE